MSSDQEPTSSAVADRFRLTLTCVFATITLLGWFGGSFLTFLWPGASDWLLPIGAVGMVVATLWLISCAFLPKPRSAPILLATLLIIVTSALIKEPPWGGLMGLGFRIHASPIDQYLAQCKRFEFTENGERHAISQCEVSSYAAGGFPPAQVLVAVMHDPTGNFLKPEAQRSAEWKRAFHEALEYVGAPRFPGARRLFSDFYLVSSFY